VPDTLRALLAHREQNKHMTPGSYPPLLLSPFQLIKALLKVPAGFVKILLSRLKVLLSLPKLFLAASESRKHPNTYNDR
jgi:hypothetical protein